MERELIKAHAETMRANAAVAAWYSSRLWEIGGDDGSQNDLKKISHALMDGADLLARIANDEPIQE